MENQEMAVENTTKTTEEKNPFKWKQVEVKLIGTDGEEKIYTYQNPMKIEAVKRFMWSLSHPQKA